MEPITRFEGLAAPLALDNVDTDQIIPARFLRKPRDADYQRWLFHDLRFAPDGSPLPGFVLNRPPFDAATILVAGRNFGVGSSREAAVYALQAFGIRAVIAESFGDIHYSNALKNGLLPIRLPPERVRALREAAEGGGLRLTVDLERCVVASPDGAEDPFAVPAFARDCLLRGLDEIGLTLTHLPEIEAFEARHAV
ncbi:MAG: 3-isopropylmalate dehydratase small subunit [Acetobacteraceae bacterium]|nr:3-isopropylmalate dehydratase small subunit [Acetobacteraceae bacterium]MCX7683670.1 3-isopropylmalate dehydratase small subunit [Acetobacteraceae bacterium]MDW8398244.1 3-isopropylmalate dehydratase small subunit [Acetobacteraceae bacterium]